MGGKRSRQLYEVGTRYVCCFPSPVSNETVESPFVECIMRATYKRRAKQWVSRVITHDKITCNNTSQNYEVKVRS